MQAQFENIFKELGAASEDTGDAPSSAAAPAAEAPRDTKASSSSGPDASFQETIRRTMERMQSSGEQATAAAQNEGSDDFMAELLKQMQAGGLGEDGLEGSEEDFSKMLMGMMEQLTNKDILYEPMKELNDKFPDWMAKNEGKISEEDRKRYELQQKFAKEIVTKFEESTYSDSNAADREYIVERMQKVSKSSRIPDKVICLCAELTPSSIDASCWISPTRSCRRYAFSPGSLGCARCRILQPSMINNNFV